MQDKKQKKAKIQVIFLILISTLVILADFYAIINYPKEYMLIAAITVIFMICLWGVISGFFSLSALKEDRREEQYDSIFKSEKASYLMLRKYFDEIEGKIEILQKESKIPTEDIINAQKGIAKVVINRNKENADAIMNSNEQLMETFEHLENKLKESNDFIIESQKNVIYDNLKDIMEKQQVLSDSIKDMEIRLSQAITANPIQFTANVEMPKQTIDAPQSAPAARGFSAAGRQPRSGCSCRATPRRKTPSRAVRPPPEKCPRRAWARLRPGAWKTPRQTLGSRLRPSATAVGRATAHPKPCPSDGQPLHAG